MTRNEWCQVLGIDPPSLAAVADHRDANSYALLLVTLLEHGQPMTLLDVAARFEEAGIAPLGRALLSLQRCKPGRPPVYREGDHYHLDPHDAELDLWAFRLGLRPPKVAPVEKPAVELPPAPALHLHLEACELERRPGATRASTTGPASSSSSQFSTLRGGPCEPGEVVTLVGTHTRYHGLNADSAKFRRQGSSITVLGDGRWAIAEGAGDALRQTRAAVREREHHVCR